jgi:hypothetical protein
MPSWSPELLKVVARQRIAAGQGELDPCLDKNPQARGQLPITSPRMTRRSYLGES